MKSYEHDAAIIEAADNFCEATENARTDDGDDDRDELPALYEALLAAVLAAKA